MVIESGGLALLCDTRQSLVRPDRSILKLPCLLPGRRHTLPHELPRETTRKRSCDDVRRLPGELGIQLGGFRDGKEIQLRIELNRLHPTIIPSPNGSAVSARGKMRIGGAVVRVVQVVGKVWTAQASGHMTGSRLIITYSASAPVP